jgi:hypothetical protein
MTQSDNVKNNEGFDAFLTDDTEAEEGVDYIKPDLELKLSKEKRMECRQIVQEIKKFGITSQRQLMYLIYLLSLEIEDIDTMKTITSAIKEGRKELGEEKKLIL